MPEESQLSQHPVDRLIRALIRREREPAPADVELIVRRMLDAPFSARRDSLRSHLAQRIEQGQWAAGASVETFLSDLHSGVSAYRSLLLYERRGGHMVMTISETSAVMVREHQGSLALPLFVVLYASDRGTLVSGYQASSLAKIALPEEVLWLA